MKIEGLEMHIGADDARNPVHRETPYTKNAFSEAIQRRKLQVNQRSTAGERIRQFGIDYEFIGNKIIGYNPSSAFFSYWALITIPHTILSKLRTWINIAQLIGIGLISAFVVDGMQAEGSIETYGVSTEIRTLLSFIIAGYVSICVARWSSIRNTYLAALMSNLEGATVFKNSTFSSKNSEIDLAMSEKHDRYARLIVQLLFQAAQKKDDSDLDRLVDIGILLPQAEYELIASATLESRPYVVIGWMHQIFVSHKDSHHIDMYSISALLNSVRQQITSIYSLLDSPLPFGYVHVIYWTTHLLLMAMACETGMTIAVDFARQRTGNNEYDDDRGHWPQNSKLWMQNVALYLIVSQAIFALFVEGLLEVCEIVQNPLSERAASVSEVFIDAQLENHIKALSLGMRSFQNELLAPSCSD